MIPVLNIVFFVLTSAFLGLLISASIREREPRAAILAMTALVFNCSLWIGFLLLEETGLIILINRSVIAIFLFFIPLSLVKFFPKRTPVDISKIKKFDERDHMFSRNNLRHHPDIRKIYYRENPEREKNDKKLAEFLELFEEGGAYYDDVLAAYVKALDMFTMNSIENSEMKRISTKRKLPASEISGLLKQIGRHMGAGDIGITRLKEYHLYSNSGRQRKNWGKKIVSNHSFGIVIVLPMNLTMMKSAPAFPEIIETVYAYVEAAKIAHVIANFIKNLGYDATAHFDGNYQVACVPMAIDAGLGALGRMGLLMHPALGPCVRLSVVTTDMSLEESTKKDFTHIDYFCDICKKCAQNCPTDSIEIGEMKESRGFKHWSVKQEKCYAYWRWAGTDCGVCIRSCPYTKPDSTVHKLARFYISRNVFNQRIALLFDDILYGRKFPLPKRNPERDRMIK